jgi:hypothetical protein
VLVCCSAAAPSAGRVPLPDVGNLFRPLQKLNDSKDWVEVEVSATNVAEVEWRVVGKGLYWNVWAWVTPLEYCCDSRIVVTCTTYP